LPSRRFSPCVGADKRSLRRRRGRTATKFLGVPRRATFGDRGRREREERGGAGRLKRVSDDGRHLVASGAQGFGAVSVINDVSLDIKDGEFAVFVGPSGGGKSTLLRLIAGLEDLTAGRILVDGKDVSGVGPAQRGLAMVFQSYALYPHMSVRANIGFALKMAGDKADVIERKVGKAAATLNLTDYLDRKPR
jgi:ABC-type proline/glycine betaine transport system ATPase subunit